MAQQNSLKDSLYISEDVNETTFKYDDQLPSLPVPEVKESINKLLETIKPIATDKESYDETVKKAHKFLADPNVTELQELLKTRASVNKNWLEAWWLEFAYLRSRKPLIPYSNMSAPLPIMQYWPLVKSGQPGHSKVRAQRAALSTYFQLCFWRMIRSERMRPMIHKGAPWSMSQFKFLFNTVRLPGEPKDELKSWFRTAREGPPVSTEVIVLHKGYIFALQPIQMSPSGDAKIMPATDIEFRLKAIEDWCKHRPVGPGIGALTSRERPDWAEARGLLLDLCPENKSILNRIDRALSVLVLDDNEPQNEAEILRLSMCGDPRNRWADKSISSIAFKNGSFGASADHTPYDGFCTGIMTHYLMTSVEECQGRWNDQLAHKSTLYLPAPDEEPFILLDLKLNFQLTKSIEESCNHFATVCDTIDTIHSTFKHFGKAILKQHRFHPEAFVQCAIHATYFRLHNKMAPAYVTASTRRFHNGRTETCRSCYPEMRRFVESLTNYGSSRPKETYELLKSSVNKFQVLMNEASNGKGCDRHLLGLYLTAILENKEVPELFDDELVQRTNNYILSTSCSGYWNVCGGVPPLVEDGYGCFYGIEDDTITFCCTAFKSCPETDLRVFYQTLETCLVEMQETLLISKL